ncbi:hypothetical protein D0Z07_3788 [Hyphodiscus hymeniophilus]|uniref:Uncharacterized protein n=1 Tax=Hyphodiscus hymeniophilus TaxID=353542 RepID=A0A9P6VL99_9HELO|nr:hypothetical protein D0Z07_3788 [Hyphodiscus hymeniophilus]
MAPINDYVPKPTASSIPVTLPELKAYILNVTKEAAAKKKNYECHRYGTFMTHFSRSHLEGIFWGLFGVVVLLLCTASYSHAKSEQLYQYDECHPNDAIELKQKHQRKRFNAVITTTICFLAAALSVALEGLAGTALMYCQQHKVINFYWAMWGLTQVGSLIAIIGVTIHQWTSLKQHKTPPWNIALGTPILVITAAAFLFGNWIKKKWLKATGSQEEIE